MRNNAPEQIQTLVQDGRKHKKEEKLVLYSPRILLRLVGEYENAKYVLELFRRFSKLMYIFKTIADISRNIMDFSRVYSCEKILHRECTWKQIYSLTIRLFEKFSTNKNQK